MVNASRSSTQAMACSSRAASRTSRVIGPVPEVGVRKYPAPSGTRPRLGNRPNTPLNAEGMRIEPPPSVPTASGPSPAAVATPAPPLEPPEVRARSHGFTASRATRLIVRRFIANSGVLLLAKIIAPACFTRSDVTEFFGRHMVLEQPRAQRRAQPLREQRILDADRQAQQRRQRPASRVLLGRHRGLREQFFRKYRNERAKLAISLHPRQQKPRIFKRRQLARGEHLPQAPGRQPCQRLILPRGGLSHAASPHIFGQREAGL